MLFLLLVVFVLVLRLNISVLGYARQITRTPVRFPQRDTNLLIHHALSFPVGLRRTTVVIEFDRFQLH